MAYSDHAVTNEAVSPVTAVRGTTQGVPLMQELGYESHGENANAK